MNILHPWKFKMHVFNVYLYDKYFDDKVFYILHIYNLRFVVTSPSRDLSYSFFTFLNFNLQ